MQQRPTYSNIVDTFNEGKNHYEHGRYHEALAVWLDTVAAFSCFFDASQASVPAKIHTSVGETYASKEVASCYFALGNCYYQLKEYPEAMNYIDACAEIAEVTKISVALEKLPDRARQIECHLTLNTPFPPHHEYWVNIPQARLGRLYKMPKISRLAGLYTDEFSTCCIVVVRSKSLLSLYHVDAQVHYGEYPALTKVIKKIQQVDGGCEVTLLHISVGEFNARNIKDYLQSVFHDEITINKRQIADTVKSVKVSFRFDSVIRLSEVALRPLNVMSHPQEDEMENARKVEALLFISNGEQRDVEPLIFDGSFWVPVNVSELQPFCKTEVERGYLERFTADDSDTDVIVKISEILQDITRRGVNYRLQEEEYSFVLTVAKDVNRYTVKDHVKMFRQNLANLLRRYQAEIEPAHFNELVAALANPKRALVQYYSVVSRAQTAGNPFSNDVAYRLERYMREFLVLQHKARRRHRADLLVAEGRIHADKAREWFLNNDYQQAQYAGDEAFWRFAFSSMTRNHPMLISNCETQGDYYAKCGHHTRAYGFFAAARSSVKRYHVEDEPALERLTRKMEAVKR